PVERELHAVTVVAEGAARDRQRSGSRIGVARNEHERMRTRAVADVLPVEYPDALSRAGRRVGAVAALAELLEVVPAHRRSRVLEGRNAELDLLHRIALRGTELTVHEDVRRGVAGTLRHRLVAHHVSVLVLDAFAVLVDRRTEARRPPQDVILVVELRLDV